MGVASFVYHLNVGMTVLESIEIGEGHPGWDVYLDILAGDTRQAQRVMSGKVRGLVYDLLGVVYANSPGDCLKTINDPEAPKRKVIVGDVIQYGSEDFLLTNTGLVRFSGEGQ
jgi:hypothetical protein